MDIRETAKATATAFASDPKGTARFIASAGAKTALSIPLKLGGRAVGPAIGVAVRAAGVLSGAATRGRQVRSRLTGSSNGQATPVATPPAPPAPPSVRPTDTPRPVAERAPAPRPVPTAVPEVVDATSGPPEAAVAAGAPGTAQETVERIEAALGEAASGADLSHDELPLPDYDHLTLASLRARLARLELTDLLRLRDYEKAHANRLPVVTMLENRIAKVGGQSAAGS